MSTTPYTRTGGLRLCQCGHAKSFHAGHVVVQGTQRKAEGSCAFCACVSYAEGTDQNLFHAKVTK